MAFGTIAQSQKPTFFENLMTQKKVAAGIFSVHLTRGKEQGSEVRTLAQYSLLDVHHSTSFVMTY